MSQDPKALREARDRVVEMAGGPRALAEALNITRQAVLQWHRVPIDHIPAIERLLGLSRYEMRPDVYGEPPLKAQHHKPRQEAAA